MKRAAVGEGSWLVASAIALLAAATPPAPDLVVTRIEVRDGGRFGLVTPTAGSNVRVTVEIENRSTTAAPDVEVACRRGASPGVIQAQATTRTGPLGAGAKKTLTLQMAGASTAGSGSAWCQVDVANQAQETDESNNILFQTYTTEANSSTDFKIELRNFQPWTKDSPGHRRLRAEVVNLSARGPALPPPAGVPQRVRWQAVCTVMQMPWVRVRQAGNMALYAGGDLPAPGRSAPATFWLHPVDLVGKPKVSTLPATMQFACALKTGAFMPNFPVIHQGSTGPQPDWQPMPAWWSQSAIYAIANPESNTP